MQQEVTFEGKFKELVWDIGALVFVLVLFVGCIAANQWRLTRKLGFVWLGLYVLFLIWQVICVWILDPPLKSNVEECSA